MFARSSALGLVSLVAVTGMLTVGGAAGALAAGSDGRPVVRSATSSYDGFAWGSNGQGQLGIGSATNPVDEALSLAAGANGAATWRSLSAGYTTACGIGANGLAYCWGDNRYGSLGNGTTSTIGDDSVPVAVLGNLSWTTLSAGGYYGGPARSYVCGIATTSDAYCWGYNGAGQLGNGSANDDSVPHLVNGGLMWTSISAGGQHTCGITSTGSAYCWGSNHYGELGDGTGVDSYTPVPVSGNRQWKAISAGLGWTCAITVQGQAYCWGYNGDGQLGNGTTTTSADDSAPAPVIPNQNASGGWQGLDAGYGSTCAIGLDDAAYCWGRNYYGQLGDGTTDDTSVPVRAALPVNEPVVEVGVGTDSEFACATTTTDVYCWGDNSSGVLGNPAGASPQLVPLAISPTWQGASVEPKALSLGGSFSLLLVGAPDPTPPPPVPFLAPSAPLDVTASAGDRSATVTWNPPESSGSFAVSDYQVTSSPGGSTCVASAPSQRCEVTGLTNGTAYTFTVKALNGAGWSPDSTPSNVVVPRAPDTPTILITGTREGARINVEGGSTALGMGGLVTPWTSRNGGDAKPGRAVLVSIDGTFQWSRQASPRSTWRVSMRAGELQSNTVVFRRR